MKVDECFQLGYVIKKHGLKGEVNIFLDVDTPEVYKELESVFIEHNEKLVPFFIESIVIKGNRAVVRFEDITTADMADALKGGKLFLPLTLLPPLKDGQFYYHQVMQYNVVDAVAGDIGSVKDIYASLKQDLLVIDHLGKEILVPINDELIKKVDHNTRKLYVDLPDGLLDIYLD